MPPPPTRDIRVVKYAERWGYAAAEWERALGAIDWAKPHAEGGPERLKLKTLPDGTTDCTVWRVALDLGKHRHEVVLKVEPLGSIRKKIQAMVRKTKAFRQWHGARELNKIVSLQVAEPAAVLRSRSLEVLALENVPGPTLLELAERPALPIPLERAIARAFAGEMGRLARTGRGGADLKGSNIVITGLNEGREPDPKIALLDTLDVRRVHKTHILFPLIAELVGTECLPRRTTLMRFAHAFVREFANWELTAPSEHEPAHAEWTRTERRSLWTSISDALIAHGDPVPKDDPLARG